MGPVNCRLRYRVRCGFSHVCRDLPDVSPFVFHHTTAIAIGHVRWLLNTTRTGLEGTSIGRVGVGDVYIEKCRHRASQPHIANHNQRIADFDYGGSRLAVFARTAEHSLEELYKLPCFLSHDSWGKSVPTFRDEKGIIHWFFHRDRPVRSFFIGFFASRGDRTCSASVLDSVAASRMTSRGTHCGKAIRL